MTGEVADLQHLRKTLFTFHAENTLVTGDLSKVIWTELVKLKLSNTKVTGNLRMALKSKELKDGVADHVATGILRVNMDI